MTEGCRRAQKAGTKFGPPFKLTPYQQQEALERLKGGESQNSVAKSFNVDRATVWRLARR